MVRYEVLLLLLLAFVFITYVLLLLEPYLVGIARLKPQ